MTKFAWVLLTFFAAGCNDQNPLGIDPFAGVEPVAQNERPVSSLTANHASAKGIWRIDGEKSAFPYNTTEIWCWRAHDTCHVASAELQLLGDFKFLDVNLSVEEVDRWTADEITYSSSGGCRRATTTLSKRDGSVVQIISTDLTLNSCKTDGKGNDELGVALLKQPRIIRMITTDEWRERRSKGLQ